MKLITEHLVEILLVVAIGLVLILGAGAMSMKSQAGRVADHSKSAIDQVIQVTPGQ